MADITDLEVAYIAAGAALLGSALGAVVPWGLQAFAAWLKQRKESRYLAILVVAHLDRFVIECVAVACDDGTIDGEPSGENGFYRPVEKLPKFAPLELDLDWKVLPGDLMRDVLDIPRKQHLIANKLAAIHEWDDRPEFSEYFWARQESYAELGLAVSDVSRRLRKLADIKADNANSDDLSEKKILLEQLARVRGERDAHNQRVAETLSRNGI